MARNPFFRFANIRRFFNVASMHEFINSENYLGGLEITFQGNLYGVEENRAEQLAAVLDLLGQIEAEIRQQVTDFEGSRQFRHDWVHDIFKDKVLKFDANSPRIKDETQIAHLISDKNWFAFDSLYGTSEENAFVRMLDRQIQKLQKEYDEIYLLRNEGHFAIYNFADGQAFQPDFVLFLREKGGSMLIYQLFIEPKGKHLKGHDRWKETFLKEITTLFEAKTMTLEAKRYRLIGVPFYNNEDENQFRESLESVLNHA